MLSYMLPDLSIGMRYQQIFFIIYKSFTLVIGGAKVSLR